MNEELLRLFLDVVQLGSFQRVSGKELRLTTGCFATNSTVRAKSSYSIVRTQEK